MQQINHLIFGPLARVSPFGQFRFVVLGEGLLHSLFFVQGQLVKIESDNISQDCCNQCDQIGRFFTIWVTV